MHCRDKVGKYDENDKLGRYDTGVSLDVPAPTDRPIGRLAKLGVLAQIGRGAMERDDELTPQEVADLLKVSPSTVRRWEKAGVLKPKRRLPGSQHRRYGRAEVEKLRDESLGITGEETPTQE